jgi:hypothetical protein
MADSTPNPPPSPPQSPPRPPPSSSQDVAQAGAWTHNAQQVFTNTSLALTDIVLNEHPDKGRISTRDSGEILEEYKPRVKYILDMREYGGLADGKRGGSSSTCVEYGSEKEF